MHGDGSERAERALAALTVREADHHQISLEVSDGSRMREETTGYAEDMQELSDDMMATCHDMMSSRSHDSEAMRASVDHVRAEVQGHHTTLDGLDDLEDMRDECERHHRAMGAMLDEIRGTLPDDGMM